MMQLGQPKIMSTDLPLQEKLLYSTVRIETEINNKWYIGTAFFINFIGQSNFVSLLFTCKHLIQGSSKGKLYLHQEQERTALPTGNTIVTQFKNFDSLWTMHPNKAIDLCAIPLFEDSIICHSTALSCEDDPKVFRVGIHEDLICKDFLNFEPFESVLMLGYPNGLFDEVNNLPIFRRGMTASHPKYDFNNKKEFLVDIGSFPGSSGSPVFLYEKYDTYNQPKNQIEFGKLRLQLMGVFFEAPSITEEGSIVNDELASYLRTKTRTQTRMHLGQVIKADELFTLKDEVFKKYSL